MFGLGLAVLGQLGAGEGAAVAAAPGITLEQAADGPGLLWVTNGPTGWFGQTEVTHDGLDALQSGPLGDGQTNTARTSIVGPGILSFYWKVSSETNHDFLNLFINGTPQQRISGDTDWTRVVYSFPVGTWMLEWDYGKDSIGKARADASWLDQVYFVPMSSPPALSLQPQNRSTVLGGYVFLTSECVGAPPFTWQWQHYGTNLPGATNWILQLGNVQTNQAGDYRVSVGNSNGTAFSATATISVVPATPQTPDFVEGNVADWRGFAHDAVPTILSNETTLVQVGQQSMRWISQSPTDTGVAYPRAGDAHWRLTDSDALAFWIYPFDTNSPAGPMSPPKVVLKTTTGDFVFTSKSLNLTNNAWNYVQVPLAGSSSWQRTNLNSPYVSGVSFLDDVNQLEFHAPTNASGFTAWLDGVRFLTAGPIFTDVVATHQAGGYWSGSNVTVSCTLLYTTSPPMLGWSAIIPSNWTYVSGLGEPDQKPVAGQTGSLTWGWINPPTGPVTFTYTLHVPEGESGPKTIQEVVFYQVVGSPMTNTATPDPLVLPQTTYHPATTLRVWPDSPNPTSPYADWGTAARTIQSAVDAAQPGDTVLVTNGVYDSGDRVASWGTYRVAVTKPVTVQSVNGPLGTVIKGDGSDACVYLTNGAILSGFMLMNGVGGVQCDSTNAILTNCTIGNNGSGAWNSTLNNCTLIGNNCRGASYSTLNNCTLIGNNCSGAVSSTLNNCTLTGNRNSSDGGGAVSSTLNNCTLVGNSVSNNSVPGPRGGGASSSILNNCTLIRNSASYSGGGTFASTLNNCALTGNVASSGGGAAHCTLTNCSLVSNNASGSVVVLFDPSGNYDPSGTGGGAYGGTLNNCTLTGNSAAYGGGACRSMLTNCALTDNSAVYGGGGNSNTLNHCILTNNWASSNGGGAYFGTLNNCTLAANWASYNGGGAASGILSNCTLNGNWAAERGGGAYNSLLSNCTVTANSAQLGGGTCLGTLNNCLLTDNDAVAYGGGAEGGALDNCTLTGNVAYGGGGVAGATLNNCIVYYNAANSGANYFFSTLNYCCALPAAGSGAGNITAEPRFSDLANGNLRLQSNSPCINAGANTYATNMTDLDGRPRLVGGAVDLGAYEYQGPGFSQFIPWLAQYGLATDGSADYSDADGDGLGNWQEWVCGTDPTNALSVLRLVSVQRSLSGATVSWQSVMDHTYSLERATRLGARPAFLPLASGIPGQPGITTFTDTNAPGSGPVFYRLGTEP